MLGKISNVNITGTINIRRSKLNEDVKLKLSRFLGDVGQEAVIEKVFSDLKYTLNGQDISRGFPGVTVEIVDSFSGGKQVPQAGLGELYPFITNFSLFDRVSNKSRSYEVATYFNPVAHPNAFRDYYTGALQRYIEMVYQTKGLMRRYFKDGIGAELPLNESASDFVLYVGETKTVRVKHKAYMLICDSGKLYDAIEDKCVDSLYKGNACPPCKIRFMGMCISKCGASYKKKGFDNDATDDMTCYPECPRWLGYTNVPSQNFGVETCLMCPLDEPEKATASLDSCELQCNNISYSALKGCYTSMVSGLKCIREYSSMENACFIPGADDCESGEYLAYLPQEQPSYASQYYTTCRLYPPPGMQQVDNSIVYKDGCVDSHLGQ